jgi:lycopene beta-cyclase
VTSPITLLDARADFPGDRTWCFWDVQPHAYRHLVRHQWGSWAFAGRGVVHRQHSASMPYCHLPSERFYEDALSRIRAAPNCTLHLGTTVDAVTGRPGKVTVGTSGGEVVAAHCFDALGTRGPTWTGAMPAPGPGVLCQRFLGWYVEVAEPVFDSSCVTLMDFDVTPNGELRFMYVLPFSPTSALVEDTTIGRHGVPPDASRKEIRGYLRLRHGIDDVTVVREEQSVLPMIPAAKPAEGMSHVVPVGTAAGAVRPSSGYAFIRTQRQVTRLADAFAAGHAARVPVERRREAALDRVFLTALDDDPPGFADHLLSLGRSLPGDRFARFMMDAATPLDVMAVISALPKRPFLRAVGMSALDGVPR